MDGQLSIFDIRQPGELKPYEYDFKRYIGQRVHVCVTSDHYIGVIVAIFPYYTTIDVEELDCFLAGTPTTCYPVDDTEKTTILMERG